MVAMVAQAERVDFRVTNSVLEALILEAKLIKELKPIFNTRDKDDKSYNYLIITVHEDFPRLLTLRGKDLVVKYSTLYAKAGTSKNKPLVYGPFPHATQFKEALKIIRNIFPFYDTKESVTLLREKNDRKLRFNESIGVYPSSDTSKEAYRKTIVRIKTLFDGKLHALIRTLGRDMKQSAKQEKFEEAGKLKRQLFALEHIEDVSLIRREREYGETNMFRIEGYDVAHLAGDDTVGVMVVVDGGEIQKEAYRTFTVRDAVRGSDTGALKEILERRLVHTEWQYPRVVVVDGGKAQINVAKKVFEQAGVAIPIIAVTKDKHHKPSALVGSIKIVKKYQREILLANAEAHRFSLAVHKKKRSKRMRT
jgi:excinuclease ABC subunit C